MRIAHVDAEEVFDTFETFACVAGVGLISFRTPQGITFNRTYFRLRSAWA